MYTSVFVKEKIYILKVSQIQPCLNIFFLACYSLNPGNDWMPLDNLLTSTLSIETSNMADGGQKQSTQPASDKKDSSRNNRQGPNKRFHSDKHSHKKRVPLKPYQRKNDIYVTGKSDFKVRITCGDSGYVKESFGKSGCFAGPG